MTTVRGFLKKTQKMLGSFFGSAGRSVSSVARHPGAATKRVFKGATGAAGKAVNAARGVVKLAKNTATHPVRAVGKAQRSVRSTTRRVRKLIKF